MDYFEDIVARLMEEDGYWIRKSVRANLTKDQKKRLGKPTMPRPEVDLVGYSPSLNELVFVEVKSLLDSTGVISSLLKHAPRNKTNRYKLLTMPLYQKEVTRTIVRQFRRQGLIAGPIRIRMGLAAGKVPKSEREKVRRVAESKGWFYLSPEEIAAGIRNLAEQPFEDSPVILAAKVLRQHPEEMG